MSRYTETLTERLAVDPEMLARFERVHEALWMQRPDALRLVVDRGLSVVEHEAYRREVGGRLDGDAEQ